MKFNKSTYLVAVSALALLVSGYAVAEPSSQNDLSAEASTSGSVEKDIKKAWVDVKHDAKEVSKQFEAYFLSDDEKVPAKKMSYEFISSAAGMIGTPIVNYKGVRVGTLKDIIVSSSGRADMIVIADGEFTGFDGKLMAYNYADIVRKDTNGDIVIPVSEKMIDKAAEFSYIAGTGKSIVRYVPQGGYSVEKILKGDVLDNNDKKVGVIEDVYFKSGEADQIIIGFDKVLGMGGNKVAANYDPANIVFGGDTLHIVLTSKQSVALSRYKKSIE